MSAHPIHAATIRQAVVLVDDRDGAASLLPVAGRPFLAWVVRELCRYGVEEVLLVASASAGQVAALLPGITAMLPPLLHGGMTGAPPFRVELAGAAVAQVRDRLAERFLLVSGDRLFDGSWAGLLADAARDDDSVLARVLRSGDGTDTGIVVLRRGIDALLPEREDAQATYRDGTVLRPAAQARPAPRPAVIFDRDGVLNLDHGYVGHREKFEWTEGAREAVRAVHEQGWHVFVATNQSGVARGYYDEPAVHALYDWMRGELHAFGATIDDWRYCPTHPEGSVPAYARESDWRKPAPGMLLDMIRAWELDPAQCVMIGDQPTDMAAAEAAGVRGFRFAGGSLHDFVRQTVLPTGARVAA